MDEAAVDVNPGEEEEEKEEEKDTPKIIPTESDKEKDSSELSEFVKSVWRSSVLIRGIKNVNWKQQFWADCFLKDFYHREIKGDQDDLIYMVYQKYTEQGDKPSYLASFVPDYFKGPQAEHYRVFRGGKGSILPNKNDPNFNWEWSYWLNACVTLVEYELVVRVGEMTSGTLGQKGSKWNFLTKVTRPVFASPAHVPMDVRNLGKADSVKQAYPMLYFTISDFDAAFEQIVVSRPGEFISVEVFARGQFFPSSGDRPLPLDRIQVFSGAVDYSVVKKGYEAGRERWIGRKARDAFVNLRGPSGIGEVILAVTRVELPTPPPDPTEKKKGFLGNLTKLVKPTEMPLFLHCPFASLRLSWDLVIRQTEAQYGQFASVIIEDEPAPDPVVLDFPSVQESSEASGAEDEEEDGGHWFHEWNTNESRIKPIRSQAKPSDAQPEPVTPLTPADVYHAEEAPSQKAPKRRTRKKSDPESTADLAAPAVNEAEQEKQRALLAQLTT